MRHHSTAEDDEQPDEPDEPVEWAGRAGLATRGVLYLVSAALAVGVARRSGAADEGPGRSGALREIAEQPFGRVLVVVLAVGLAGYAVWRAVQAIRLDVDDEPAKAWAKRTGLVARSAIYLAGTATAVRIAWSDDPDRSGGASGPEGRTGTIFDLPGGRLIVAGIGIGLLVAAGYNGYRAVAGNFEERWRHSLRGRRRRWAKAVAAAGLAGHMLVLALVGTFGVKAAWEYDPTEPEGLDEAAKAIADATYGTAALYLLAAAMLAYAGFSLIEATWRRVGDDG